MNRCRQLVLSCLVIWLTMGLALSSTRDSSPDPFVPLENHIEQKAPDWWPQYQVVQTALQDQRPEDARLLLEPLLKDQAEDEAAFQLLGPRYLWLTQAPPDCAVLDALSETPAPWLSGIQRFCHYLAERRQSSVGAAEISTWHGWAQWLFGIKTRQALLTEQVLSDLQGLQTEQPGSLTLAGLVSVLMQWRGASASEGESEGESDIEQFWQSQNPAENVKRVAIYWQLTDALAKQVWFEETPVKQGGWSFFGMQGAEAGAAAEEDVDNRGFLGNVLDFLPFGTASETSSLPSSGRRRHSGSEIQRRQTEEVRQRIKKALEQPPILSDNNEITSDYLAWQADRQRFHEELERRGQESIQRQANIVAAQQQRRLEQAAQKRRLEQAAQKRRLEQAERERQKEMFKLEEKEILADLDSEPIESREKYLALLRSHLGVSVADRNQRITDTLNELEFEISFEQANTLFFTECFFDVNNALITFQNIESNFPDRDVIRVKTWINECQKKLDSISADLKAMGREYDRKKEVIYRRYGADPLGTLKAHLELLQGRSGGSISNQYEAIARVHRTMDDIRDGRLWVMEPKQYEPEPGYLDSVWHWVWGQPADEDDDLSMHDLSMHDRAETGHCSTQGCSEPFINPLSDSVLMVAGAMPSAIDLNWSKGYYWERFVQYMRHFATKGTGWNPYLIGAVAFTPASLSTNADLKFRKIELNYQGRDSQGLPVYKDEQGQRIEMLTVQSNVVTLPNGKTSDAVH